MRTAILVPCYKRPEYTRACLEGLEAAQAYPDDLFVLVDDGSRDGTAELLLSAHLPKEVVVRDGNLGLRATLLEFVDRVREGGFDYLGVVGNDCVVPTGWLDAIVAKFRTTDADVLSPNVSPSNAAFTYGRPDTEGKGYRPSTIVGGLWFMRVGVLDGVTFDPSTFQGITGAFNVLQRILWEKDPRVGWLPDVVVQDVGHWSGRHPAHIKSEAHSNYSHEVGRRTSW